LIVTSCVPSIKTLPATSPLSIIFLAVVQEFAEFAVPLRFPVTFPVTFPLRFPVTLPVKLPFTLPVTFAVIVVDVRTTVLLTFIDLPRS
jgi:hypothetical protein